MMPDGSRLHVVIPDITRRHMAVNIRKFVLQAHSLDELVALGTLTAQAARFLEAAVASGLNILVSGGTQAGKTTLLNCLVCGDPGARAGGHLRGGLRAPGAAAGRRLDADPPAEPGGRRRDPAAPPGQGGAADAALPASSSARCARRSASTCSSRSTRGLPGMCTLHANSAREAVVKMCTLPLLAGENIGTAFVVPTVASSVDLVVHVGTDVSGHRRVREIVALPGRAEDGVIETADVFTTPRRPAGPGRRLPAAPRPIRARRLRPRRAARGSGMTESGALLGLLLGIGLLLVWRSGPRAPKRRTDPRRPGAPPAAARRGRR